MQYDLTWAIIYKPIYTINISHIVALLLHAYIFGLNGFRSIEDAMPLCRVRFIIRRMSERGLSTAKR